MKRPPICWEVASSECIFVGNGGSKVGFLIAEAPLAILGALVKVIPKIFVRNGMFSAPYEDFGITTTTAPSVMYR